MNIIYLERVDSTQNYIKSHREIAPGTAVLAGEQTAGRGRLGRSFASAAGRGMYLSVALAASEELMDRLTPAAAVAGLAALKELGVDCGIKWVNDLVVLREGRFRKLCGILTELSGGRLIVGAGINISQTVADFPPELADICTSVALEGGQAIPPALLAERYCAQLERVLALSHEELFRVYAANCVTVGREVLVKRTPDDPGVPAFCRRLSPDFGVEVEYPDGSRETLTSGEASVKLG